jgi:hypothetical protein
MDEKQKNKEYGFGRFSEYRDHLGYVVLCAPDEFPVRDYLAPNDQMTLEKAFGQLRRGLPVAYDRIKDKDAIPRAAELLEASYEAYKKGDRRAGAFLLQDFEATLLELRRGRPRKA